MADKYIIQGATFDGDGTASNEAASAGAAGAWNRVAHLTGTALTYGSLAAGDVVNIRSKTSAGADITVTATSNLTFGMAGTASAPVTWILDNGSIWSGIDGTLTFTHASTWQYAIAAHNHFLARTKGNLRLVCTNTNLNGNTILVVCSGAVLTQAHINWATSTGAGAGGNITGNSGAGSPILNNCVFKPGKCYQAAIGSSQNDGLIVINPDIELTVGQNNASVFNAFQAGQMWVYGGRVYGSAAVDTWQSIVRSNSLGNRSVNLAGFVYPQGIKLCDSDAVGISGGVYSFACDDKGGGEVSEWWGRASSRQDGNFPTLNATFPDTGNTTWSWWVYPHNADSLYPAVLAMAKFYSSSSAAKTVTVEALVASTFALNKGNFWIDVSYVDSSTGARVGVTSFDVGSLTTSTAAWSAATYGAVSLNKVKLAVTTPTAVKQNTNIVVTLTCKKKSGSAGDIFFYCPDPQLS